MKKRLFFLSLSLLLLPLLLLAQTPAKNAAKYDYFRHRLVNEMMYFSDDAMAKASHLPMERRFKVPSGTVGLWADATWWQGHYIAVLATEYALEKRDGKSTVATLAELRQAVEVYNRLDLASERCFGDSSVQIPNGFYLRDDVDEKDAKNLKVNYVQSDYINHCGRLETRGNSPSQDQAWASYIGFALAQKLVDDSTLHQEIADIAYRMVKRMQWADEKGKVHWQIVNPVTGVVVQKEGDIQWLQYPHAAIGTMLSGRNLFAGNSAKGWKGIWNILKQNVLIDRDGHFTWYGVMSLAAVLNDGAGNQDCYEWLVKTNEKIVSRRPDLQQTLFFPHLPLVNLVLYGTEDRELVPKERYIEYLDAAPASGCITTEIDGNEVRTAAPWHSLSLFCPWHLKETGDANMLDYMLLYNLYRLIYE